ncbi:MAG: hypothetical protein HKN17_09410, partial [Rhodothermales bacterium]|nr:hypothetical protein [Rhodothermales bacterium]
ARFRGATTRFRAGAGLDDGRSYPQLTVSVENARFDASATWSGRSNAWIDHTGFFEYAPAFSDPPDVRSLSASVSARGAVGLLSVEPRITFVREVDAPVRMLGGDAVTSTAGTLSGAAARSTVSLRIALNDAPSRGPYAVVAPTLHSADLEVRTELDRAWKSAVPDAWVEGRAGYRRLMFKGDLDLDAYARGRVWTDMRGRRLHTPTGLLMLAPDGSGTVGSSGMLDIVAEAGIRGATIILAWENVLSGTSVQIGNLIVPDYPLPAQRLRFGVYWPISN